MRNNHTSGNLLQRLSEAAIMENNTQLVIRFVYRKCQRIEKDRVELSVVLLAVQEDWQLITHTPHPHGLLHNVGRCVWLNLIPLRPWLQ